MKKRPKNWNKLSLPQQEAWLTIRHQELTAALEQNFRELSQVRGGYKVDLSEDLSDRPDLSQMKAENDAY